MQENEESGGPSGDTLDSSKPQPIEERITKKLEPEQSEAQFFQSEQSITKEPVEPNEESEKLPKKLPETTQVSNFPVISAPRRVYEKSKVGRQRTVDRTKQEVFFYLFATGHLDKLLSRRMIDYNKQHYIRKEGKYHAKYLEWKREYTKQHNTKQSSLPSKIRTYEGTTHRTSDSDRGILVQFPLRRTY